MNKTSDGKVTIQGKESIYLNISKAIDLGALVVNSNKKCSIKVEVCNNGEVSSSTFSLAIGTNYINLVGGTQKIGGFNGKLDYENTLFGCDFPVNQQTGAINESAICGSNYIKITNNSSAALVLDISAYLEKCYDENQIIK